MWLRIGTGVVVASQHGDEPSFDIKGGEFLFRLEILSTT
jgi:hypothetical protein